MHDSTRIDDYHCLGLEPASSRAELEKAYFHMRTLYSEDSLATYGLFEEDERALLLDEIEAAYGRLNAAERELQPAQATCAVCSPDPMPPLDDSTSPAEYLRLARENRGMTLQEIARHTKIGTRYLAMIEEESYEMLPAPVYLRGFVFDFARTVGVPAPEEVARRYVKRCRESLDRQA